MIQLTYQPALDPYHAIFRMLRLRSIIREVNILHIDHVRIIDFYLLFPFMIDKIRLAPKHQKYRKISTVYKGEKPYGKQPDKELLFDRMKPMQLAALDTLASHGLINLDELRLDLIRPTEVAVPKELATRIATSNEQQKDLMCFLFVLASEYDVSGPNGLKARTELMEYRYDAI
jgi:hypothetical protein